MEIVKYYMVEGYSTKYALYTDALNKAVLKYPGRATSKIQTYYTTLEKWQTIERNQ